MLLFEFQPAKPDDAGLAYLIYEFCLEELKKEKGFAVIPGEEAGVFLSLEKEGCVQDPGCLSRVARSVGAPLAVTALVDRKGRRGRAGFSLVLSGEEREANTLVREFSPGEEETMAKDLAVAVRNLVATIPPSQLAEIQKPTLQKQPPSPPGPSVPEREEPLSEGAPGTKEEKEEGAQEEPSLEVESPPALPVSRKKKPSFDEEEGEGIHEEKVFGHKGQFFIEISGGYGMGESDNRYLTLLTLSPGAAEVTDSFSWQAIQDSEGFPAFSIAFGFAARDWMEAGIAAGLIIGQRTLRTGYQIYDPKSGTVTESTLGEDRFQEVWGIDLILTPMARFFPFPFKKTKPFVQVGIPMLFYPGFSGMVEPFENRPLGFALGMEGGVGFLYDFRRNVGFFLFFPVSYRLMDTIEFEEDMEGGTLDAYKVYPEESKKVLMRGLAGIQFRF